MAWTDDELRAAIHEVLRKGFVVASHNIHAMPGELDDINGLRHLLTALGVDHQPKPVLPTEVGSVIYDVVDTGGNTYSVLTLDSHQDWCGVDQDGEGADLAAEDIVSFGGVLDLDKVRGEQGE